MHDVRWGRIGPGKFKFVLLLAAFFAFAQHDSLFMPGAYAQDVAVEASAEEADQIEAQVEEQVPEPLKPLSEDDISTLREAVATINQASVEVDALGIRVDQQEEDLVREVLATRLDRAWMFLLQTAVAFADDVAAKRDAGFDVTEFEPTVVSLFDKLPSAVQEAVDRISKRVILPDSKLPAAEQAAVDELFFSAVSAVTKTYKQLMAGLEVAEKFGIDTDSERQYLSERLSDTASNFSVYLELAQAEANGFRSGAAILPADQELTAKLKLADSRVRRIATVLENNIQLMTRLDIPTAQYKQQLLSVTGQISSSVLDIDVVGGLLADWTDIALGFLTEQGPQFLFQAFIFFLIIYLSIKLSQLVQHGLERAMENSGAQVSRLLRSMVLGVSRNIIVILGVLIALSQFGISLTPLLTGLGIAGFIVGFALQDSLSNFASGMMILFYRPFDVGDTIEAAGARGKVSSMSLVNTTIRTFDNQSLIIPNNKVWQDVITNVTDQRERRVDMVFGITYDEDIDRVEKLLMAVVTADERVLQNPEPTIKVGSFSDSSVDILVRPWVKTDDYWDVLWDLNKAVKQAFDREGVTIPFPQRDVHVFQEQAPANAQVGSEHFDTPDVPEGNEPAAPEPDQQ